MRWSFETLNGNVLDSGEVDVNAAPLAATHITTLDFAGQMTEAQKRDMVVVAELVQGDMVVARNIATFVPNKHLSLDEPELGAVGHGGRRHAAHRSDRRTAGALRGIELRRARTRCSATTTSICPRGAP